MKRCACVSELLSKMSFFFEMQITPSTFQYFLLTLSLCLRKLSISRYTFIEFSTRFWRSMDNSVCTNPFIRILHSLIQYNVLSPPTAKQPVTVVLLFVHNFTTLCSHQKHPSVHENAHSNMPCAALE